MADIDTNIIRKQTDIEKEDFQDISKKSRGAEVILRAKAGLKEQEVNKAQTPFAKKIPYPFASVIEDFNKQVKMAELNKVGFLGNQSLKEEDLEKLRMKVLKDFDWTPYEDPKNFIEGDSGEHHDQDLTKKNQGLGIFVKYRRYIFKDHRQRYTVSESAEEAVSRTRAALKKANS